MLKRRSFIKKAAAATAGAFTLPYILPSGRLFAATGTRVVDHVVFCLFAGGIRNFESVQKADGNLMPNMLNGTESISGDISGGINMPGLVGGPTLQTQGTLFKEFRFAQGPTGHYAGHSTAITGIYDQNDLNIRQRPSSPTIFELYRKFTSPTTNATNAWWVSDSLGPYPALNFSDHPDFGAAYGANYIQPASIISQSGYNALGDPKQFSNPDLDKVANMREFFDNNFANQFVQNDAGVTNDLTGKAQIEAFFNTAFTEAIAGQYNDPWGIGNLNNDQFNMFFAEQVIKEFKPELTVVNMQGVDVCHTNFTGYCNNLAQADYALAHLWQTIQSTPGMQDNTVLIAVPEHGRNLEPNTLQDTYGRYALDHTSDDTSREIFCMVLGPSGKVVQGQEISTVTGQSTDVVPTIAHVLGIYDEVQGYLPGTPLYSAFV